MFNMIVNNPLIGPIWCSILCGAIIGLEREISDKSAGIRTNIFICVGAAIYSYLSISIEGALDSSRVIAQIVSGIGFIGGGVIIFNDNQIQGVTTAAIIWLTAAIGILNGLGMYFEAIMSAITLVVVGYLIGNIKFRVKK